MFLTIDVEFDSPKRGTSTPRSGVLGITFCPPCKIQLNCSTMDPFIRNLDAEARRSTEPRAQMAARPLVPQEAQQEDSNIHSVERITSLHRHHILPVGNS